MMMADGEEFRTVTDPMPPEEATGEARHPGRSSTNRAGRTARKFIVGKVTWVLKKSAD
jgi:hypothetical protein